MGVDLVGAVSAHWGHLPAGPYKILVRMALVALDKPNSKGDDAGVYWRGWQDLAIALGREIPYITGAANGALELTRRRKVIRNEVIRHTTYLRKAGAIEQLVDNPGHRTRQVWKVTPTKASQIVRPEAHES